MKLKTLRHLIFSTLILVPGASFALPILWVGDSSGNLGTVDVTTGDVDVIGSFGAGVVMTDIAFNSDGDLFGITFGSLYSIDTTTGAASFIGNHGAGGTKNSLVFGDDGTLYTANNSLHTIDVLTGASTVIGNGGDSYNSSGDLAFIDGDLFLSSTSGFSDKLVELDTSNGFGSDVGSIGVGAVYGLATDNNQDLYGVAGTSVYDIDVNTGVATFSVNYGGKGLGNAWGSAFYEESGASVPTPTSLALLAIGLFGLGFTKKRCS